MDINYSGMNMTGSYNGITDGQYKYIRYSFNDVEMLFNLKYDPKETNDLSTKQPGKLASMRNLLIK